MNKMPVSPVQQRLSYDAISKRVYQGEVLLFSDGGTDLLDMARALCQRVFDTYDIEKAHEKYSRKRFLLLAAEIQEAFNQPAYKDCFADWLRHIGINIAKDLYWDTLGMRISAPVNSHGGGFRSHVGVHRDTWGCAIQGQINWWAPIMPLAYKRTMAFYPDYWQRPIENTTARWSFSEYLRSRRAAKTSGRAARYPSAPSSIAKPLTPPYLVKPLCGQLLAFSAAHLHSSVLNHTGRTRFSLEIRTVRKSHIRRGWGAPNVDCESAPPLYQLFNSVKNQQEKLSQALAVEG